MLIFNLKKEWFEKIKSGEKTHEYREVKPYWTKRLYKRHERIEFLDDGYSPYLFRSVVAETVLRYYNICFVCGYANKNDKDKRLKAIIKSITIINGKNTDLAIDKDVYDIEFELMGEK